MKSFLIEVKGLVKKEEKRRKESGEEFNVFSITRKESNEQQTHSAFIAELLNPKGKHYMGDFFLKYFLNLLEEEDMNEGQGILKDKFNKFYNSNKLDATEVVVEKKVGDVEYLGIAKYEKNDLENLGTPTYKNGSLKKIGGLKEREDLKGGRIDILLKLRNNNLRIDNLSIENKIYAPDQPNQVIRYHNYEKKTNIVFFLTLNKQEPNEESKGPLESGIDFCCITYSYHIRKWLDKCMEDDKFKNAPNIIKYTIQQYLILIKKLTGQTENSIEMNKLIYKNLDASEAIFNNYERAIDTLRNDFRDWVFDELSESKTIKDNYQIDQIDNKGHKQIFIRKNHKENNKPKVYFGIDSFSKVSHNEENLYGGIRNSLGNPVKASIINDKWDEEGCSLWWPLREVLNEKPITNEYLVCLKNDDIERKKVIEGIVKRMLAFINDDNIKRIYEASKVD